MKACLLILLMLTAPSSFLFSEELSIIDSLDYQVSLAEKLPDDLLQYEVIVISTPSKIFKEDEIQRLKDFVESGGGLMLLAEENNTGGTTIVLNQISKEFSITFNIDEVYDDQNSFGGDRSWVILNSFPSHPVFEGVTSIVYTSGCSIKAEGLLVQSSENAYAEKYDGMLTYKKGDFPTCMVFLEMGKGRVFACGDKELFDKYLFKEDNILFALNVFDWLAGNPDRIQERLDNKSEISQLISEIESELQSARDKGLEEVDPETVQNVETLISRARDLYDSYKFVDCQWIANQARECTREGESKAQKMVESKIETARVCLSGIEKEAREYLPSELKEAFDLLEEINHERTYFQKLEKAERALSLCEEIHIKLAEREINLAIEMVKSYKGLFEKESHKSAQEYLENAKNSYDREDFSRAREYALQSQKYYSIAAEEQKVDYVLVGCSILLMVLVCFLYRGRLFKK